MVTNLTKKVFMARPYKASNKTIIQRSSSGQFRKTTMEDLGIGGTCPECRHLLFWTYFGKNPQMPDPRETGYECPHCGYRINHRGEKIEKNPNPLSQQPVENKPVCNSIEKFFDEAIKNLKK
jgi:ssDNA-binding Zn-finger/Zn-ribbon topoisomerase 1